MPREHEEERLRAGPVKRCQLTGELGRQQAEGVDVFAAQSDIAVQVGKEAVVVNRAVPDYDMTEGVFRFRTPLDLPDGASKVVLVVEETTTGVWGSTRVDLATAERPAS